MCKAIAQISQACIVGIDIGAFQRNTRDHPVQCQAKTKIFLMRHAKENLMINMPRWCSSQVYMLWVANKFGSSQFLPFFFVLILIVLKFFVYQHLLSKLQIIQAILIHQILYTYIHFTQCYPLHKLGITWIKEVILVSSWKIEINQQGNDVEK